MSSATVPYFHPASLRQRYRDELDDALQNNRLNTREHGWLQGLLEAPGSGDCEADPLRVDRLMAGSPRNRHIELSTGLLLSHALTDIPQIYLYTLGLGIEIFANRTSLLDALRARYAQGDVNAVFEYEKVESDPFKAQMLAMIDHQAEQIAQLATQLKQTPTLQGVSTSLPAVESAQVPRRYAEQLAAWWNAESASRNHRQQALASFENSVRDQVYRRHGQGLLTGESCHALLSLLKLLPGQTDEASPLRCYRLAIRVGDEPLRSLAGTFLIKPQAGVEGSQLWFSPDHQWLGFADETALLGHLATPSGRAQLSQALALEDRSVLQREGVLQIGYAEILAPPCEVLLDSIIALQARNLVYTLGLPRASDDRSAMIDDALDIRQLLDPRQLCFTEGRWRREAPFDFSAVWLEPLPVPSTDITSPAPAASLATPNENPAIIGSAADENTVPSWREQTRAFDQRAEHLRTLDCVLLDHAEQALQRYLCVWSGQGLDVRNTRLQWLAPTTDESGDVEVQTVAVSETRQAVSIDLPSLLLEWVTGHRPQVLAPGAQVVGESGSAARHLPVDLINHVLTRVCAGFTEDYASRFEHARVEGLRAGDRPYRPEQEALALRTDAMRLYLALAGRQNWIDGPAQTMILQVLDQPQRTLRLDAGKAMVEVSRVQLSFGQAATALLCDALVLSQPQVADSPLVLWSSVSGWLSFASINRLQHMLARKLGGGSREPWHELLSERDRRRLSDHLARAAGNTLQIRLERIDGHALETLQNDVLQRQLQDLRQLCARGQRWHFEAGLFSRMAAHCEIDSSLNTLVDVLSVKVQTSLFEALLPPWLGNASIADMGTYCDLLQRYYVSSDGGKDFMFGISSLQGFARKQLRDRLNLDFPGQGIEPDRITVTSRNFVNAVPAAGELPSGLPAATVVHSESLTDYAINRFATHQGAVLSVVSTEHPQITHTMTGDYLRQLVRSLNVGDRYVNVLRQALSPNDERFEMRKRLFVEQLPAMLLAVALADKLKGRLSASAYDLLESVFNMPDGIAREPVNGVRGVFSPLQLVADDGMTPDPVTGVFVICPENAGPGPWVLYAIHHGIFTFREYSGRAALEGAIRSDAALQELLLERVEPEVHRRYAHGGFIEPHLPFSTEGFGDIPFGAPGPVTVGIAEVKGNALLFLFKSTIKLMLDLGISNSVTNDQEDQAGRVFLAKLGFEQVLSLLPNKLAALVTLWQSQTLLQASAASVSGRHWGEAFSEFTAALGVMVSAREQALQEQVLDAQEGAVSGGATDDEEDVPPVSSWRASALDAEQKVRLQRLEAQGVALTDMRHDPLLNLYVNTEDGATYAVVAGKVYQVRHIEEESQWLIVGLDGTSGPRLVLDSNQHWHLDLTLRLRGGGGTVTKIKAGKVDKSAQDILVIEARGMPEIRLLYRDRARRIGQAHLKAKRYLETCLDNLSPHQNHRPLDTRVSRIISDFFGVASPTPPLLDGTLHAAKALFSAIMDASLSPFTSQRFVVGSTRPGHEMVTAFVIKSDPKQRVYLTEQFFLSPTFAIKPDALAKGFSVEVHHRAANLIHELSHLALDTHDIAYLEAMAPFPDMLLEDTAMNTTVKASVTRLHETRLSHRSNRDALFTLMENGVRRDIEADDGRGYQTILKVTRTRDLDDARDVFLADAKVRSELILLNADSVTLLLLQLGRENFVVPSP